MPYSRRSYRNKTYANRRNRTYNRSSRRSRRKPYYRRPMSNRVAVYRNITTKGPFPDQMKTVFTYADGPFNLQSSTDITVYHGFRLNSLFDPDYTGAGGQPKYFDTLCGVAGTNAPYYNFRVMAAKITITCFPHLLANSDLEYLGISLSANPFSNTPPAQTLSSLEEGPYCKTMILRPRGEQGAVKLSMYVPMQKFFGTTYEGMHNLEYAGNAASTPTPGNPARQCVAFVGLHNTSGGTVHTRAMDFYCKIKYYAELFNMNTAAAQD